MSAVCSEDFSPPKNHSYSRVRLGGKLLVSHCHILPEPHLQTTRFQVFEGLLDHLFPIRIELRLPQFLKNCYIL